MATYKRGRGFKLETTENKSNNWPERESNWRLVSVVMNNYMIHKWYKSICRIIKHNFQDNLNCPWRFFFNVSVDEDKACARDVHIKCNERFLTLMTQSGQSICSDAKVWFDCYKTENQECNSKLINQYAKFVEKTYNKLASPCQRVEL